MGYSINSAAHLVGMWLFALLDGDALFPNRRYANAGVHGHSNRRAASHPHGDPFGNGNGDSRTLPNASANPVPHAAAHSALAGLGPTRRPAGEHALVAHRENLWESGNSRFRRPADLHRHVRRTKLGADWHTPMERTGTTAAGHSCPQSRRKLAGGHSDGPGHVN